MARIPLSEDALWGAAQRALEGVGDRELGEWRETTPSGAVHLRRRLTDAEADGLDVVDIRGTFEATKRVARVDRFLPPGTPIH